MALAMAYRFSETVEQQMLSYGPSSKRTLPEVRPFLV